MLIKNLTLIFLVVFSMNACVCHKTKTQIPTDSPEQIVNKYAQQKYVDDFKIDFNNTQEYALVYKRFKKFSEIVPNISYFVVSISENQLIIEDTLKAGNVYWLNDYAIRAIIREQKAESRQRIYTFDVKRSEYILD